jgi:endo-alpha-1,4-polygalactosaminidase (GH114 family)
LQRVTGRTSSRIVGLLAAVALALLTLAPAVGAAPRDPRLQAVRSFAFAIGTGAVARPLDRYDLVIVDGEEPSAGRVAALRRAGAIVLAYLDVGTIESGRSWSRAARPYRLDLLAEWGEWYADVRDPRYRSLIARRVAPRMLRKGFDGLFLDNTDMVESHPRQGGGMRRLAASLAALVHRRGGLLFTQNGEQSIGSTLRYYDGWNREDVSFTYDFGRSRYVARPARAVAAAQASLRRIAGAGLLVTATDYVPAGDYADTATAVQNACAAGALPFVSDIQLTRVPAEPLRC